MAATRRYFGNAAHLSGIHVNISISALTCTQCANIDVKLRRRASKKEQE